MTTQKEKNKLASLACKVLKAYYGFGPSRNQIVLLEGCFDSNFCEQLLFTVRGKGFEYEIKHHYPCDVQVDGVGYRVIAREAEPFYMK